MTGRGKQRAVTFSARLLTLRKARGLTLRDLETASGIERGTINRIERGVANPRLGSVQALAAALNVSLSELFKGL